MFKKQLIAVLIFGLISTALIAYSVVNVSGQSNSFESSGYVHVSASDNSNKRILFNSGTTYKKKVGDVISFNDSTGEQSKVDVNNFIHFDDSSISSFVEGVLVDLEELSDNPAIDHYALAPNTVLSQSGSSYTILNSSENYSFKDVIWKIGEDKYLLVSPSMKLTIGEDDERDISTYAEISYIGDSLIQIQTEDNVWQTISDNAHIYIDNGLDIDLSNKAIQSSTSNDSENNVLLDFSRIVIDGEDNVEISPLVGTRNGETIIPHFNITAEDGADGINGTSGTNGAAGGSGQSGTNGNQGDDGNDGNQGNAGDVIDGDIKDFPVFTILDWTIDNTSCTGKIKVKEKLDPILDDDGNPTGQIETSMLAYYNQTTEIAGSIRIQDLSSGDTINPISVSGDPGQSLDQKLFEILNTDNTIDFSFSGLQPDHSYLLLVDAITSYDNGTSLYLRPFISKTFWTDSLGIYAEAAHSTETSIGFDVVAFNNNNITSSSTIGYAVYDDYDKAAGANLSNLNGAISGSTPKVGGTFDSNRRSTNSYTREGGLDINTIYYVRIFYNFDGQGSYDGMLNQILEVPTLKPKAYIGSPILRENQTIFGFNVDPGIIRDEYSSFVSYSYEFYEYKTEKNPDGTDKRDSAGNIILNIDLASGPKKAVTTKVHDTLSVSVGSELTRSVQYCVRTVATFFDNEKYYTLTSGFSNPATLPQTVKPFMYFVGNSGASEDISGEIISGTNVKVDDYDNIHGRLVIQPGDGGAYLALPGNGDSYNSPTIVIKKDGYYYAQYPVYLSTDGVTSLHPSESDAYMLATVDEDHVVTIHLNDPLDTLTLANNKVMTIGGTQPTTIGEDGNPVPSTYEITLLGDIVDGTTVSSNIQIGRCQITVGNITPILATFTITPENRQNSEKPLKDAALKLTAYPKAGLSTAEQNARDYNFEREKGSISTHISTDGSGNTITEYQTDVPGTIKSITIDLFGENVDEKYLEEVTTYLSEGEAGYDDASNPDHIKEQYVYPTNKLLASRTLYRGIDDDIINQMFSDLGYILTERFFFPDTEAYTNEMVDSIFALHPDLTIYVKEAYDYAYGKNNENDTPKSFNGVQDKYSYMSGDGKILNSSTNKYFYANIFRAGNPSTDPNILLINKYDFNGVNRRACYITQSVNINPINDPAFEKLTNTNNSDGSLESINAKASYSNITKTLSSVTYYVYDAVDFYAGDNIQLNSVTTVNGVDVANDYKYIAPYNNNEPKIYNANTDITQWFDVNNPSLAGKYETPVHLDGLELAKITIKVNTPESTEYNEDEIVPGTPEIKFIPMSRQEYANENYGGDTEQIPQIDPNSSVDNPVYLLFIGDRVNAVNANETIDTSFTLDHFVGENANEKNEQLYESTGHQFVIAWTAQIKIQDEGKQMIYPFDSYVNAPVSYYTDGELAQATQYPFNLFATELQNNKIKECTPFANSLYVSGEYPDATFGHHAYMLIPHSTIGQDYYWLDSARKEPEVHSLLYDVDSSNMTIRTTLYDFDNAVIRDSEHPGNAKYYRIKGESFITDGTEGDLVVATSNPQSIDDATIMKNLLNNENEESENEIEVSEIKVTYNESSDPSNIVSAVVPVQRYNDKYTINGKGVHGETPSNDTGYVTQSTDSNWKIQNNSNKSILKKYIELFTSEFSVDEKKDKEQLSVSSLNAKFYWTLNAVGQINNAVMAIEGPTDVLKHAVGFRIYFKKGEQEFYVDKLLPSIDNHNREGNQDVSQFETIGSTTRIRFKISLSQEIIKLNVPDDSKINQNGEIKTYAYPNLNGQTDIKVSYELLYASEQGGYKYLEKTFGEDNPQNLYSDETFSIKQLYLDPPDDVSYVSSYNDKKYLAFGSSSGLSSSIDAGYASGNPITKLGSFFNLRLSKDSHNEPKLDVISTRTWILSGINTSNLGSKSYETHKNLTTDVSSSSSSTMTNLIPLITKTLGQRLEVDSYNSPCLPYINPETADQFLRKDDKKSTFDTPAVDPYVAYGSETTTSDTARVKISYTGMDDEVVYFTLSKRVIDDFFDNSNVIHLYKLTDTTQGSDINKNVSYETGWVSYNDTETVQDVQMNDNRYYGSSSLSAPNFGVGGEYAGLSEYFMPVTVSQIDGLYSTKLNFANLASNKEYSVICWRFIDTGDSKRLVPADMIIASDSDRVNNHLDFKTKSLPKVDSSFSLLYSKDKDINSTLKYDHFDVDLPSSSDDPRAIYGYYTLIEIRNSSDEFVTYLDLIETGSTTTDTFDADGVVEQSSDINTTKFIYSYNQNELGNGQLTSNPSRLLCNTIEYGKEYKVLFRTYRKNEGPAYMTQDELNSYDWNNDPLSVLVDRTTIDQSNYLNETPVKTFIPNNQIDLVNPITASTNLSTTGVSSFTFILKGLQNKSYSTRNMSYLPIAIWEHLDTSTGTTKYYDVTRFLEYTSDSDSGVGNDGASHALSGGDNAKINFTSVDPNSGTISKIFPENENIHVLLYSRQIGSITNLTDNGGLAVGSILGEEALLTNRRPSIRNSISAKDFFVGRCDFEPFYSNTDREPTSHEISQQTYADLTSESFKYSQTGGYTVGSRLMRKSQATTQDTDISVGKVTVTPVDSNTLLVVNFSDYKLINQVDYLEYTLKYVTKYKDANNIEREYSYDYTKLGSNEIKDDNFGVIASTKEGSTQEFGYSIDISSFIADTQAKFGQDGRTGEEDCRLEFTLQFFMDSAEGSGQPDQVVKFAASSENKEYRKRIFVPDSTFAASEHCKMEYNIYFNDIAEKKDTVDWVDPDNPGAGIGWYNAGEGIRKAPTNSPLMSFFNNINNFAGNLLNNLFGGNDNGK